jgi:hypothetical protein
MKPGDKRATAQTNTTYTATLPSDFHQTLRQSLSQSLARYYALPEEVSPELKELLARLDERARTK